MSVTSESPGAALPQPDAVITRPLILLFGASVGIIVTNVFAPQTLVGPIGQALGLSPAASGLIATATLLGYAAGLFLLVPLADLVENRRLILRMLLVAVLGAALAALSPTAPALLAALFLLGAACTAIQVMVPIAAAMAAPEHRGRVIGDIMSGLMVGILLSRPLASGIADAWGWRAYYALSAVAMAGLTGVLATRLSPRRPLAQVGYPALIASLWHLLRSEPVLRSRALTASLVMAAFSLFWTAVALRLAQPPFDLGQSGVALFALVGAGGAAVTPLAGRAGDRGWTRPATIASHLAVIAGFGLAAWGGAPGATTPILSLVAMGVSAVVLDIGVTADQTLGRRAVNLLRPEARGRLNGLFVGLFFLGGAAGSAAAGLAWAAGGWPLVCLIGAGIGLAALVADILGRAS
jgi:predicted MFS family arabinose efflux permease